MPTPLVTLAAARQRAKRRWRTFKEQAQMLLGRDRVAELVLHNLGKSFCHSPRERRPAMVPAPNCHTANTEEPRCIASSLKRYPEGERMLARRNVSFEA